MTIIQILSANIVHYANEGRQRLRSSTLYVSQHAPDRIALPIDLYYNDKRADRRVRRGHRAETLRARRIINDRRRCCSESICLVLPLLRAEIYRGREYNGRRRRMHRLRAVSKTPSVAVHTCPLAPRAVGCSSLDDSRGSRCSLHFAAAAA
ncbi:unnamed protein product [Trichogramma brassicae]|uniref:Uncharacterized protein n=1 Tax=Trichogramma brassicae TaxID=86971 RepID=A0A6H5IU23_9HYME|nr:unnamed protein product [Trichogramma brassicae]